MLKALSYSGVLLFTALSSRLMPGQQPVTGRVVRAAANKQDVTPAVLWLEPVSAELAQRLAWKHTGPYRLVQKNKMFSPHLLVIPAGATVSFPNEDPFFHNVFSLFNGQRFDLGLYESGTSKDLPFARAGISYLFCNIHPQMSAVVIALKTPLFSLQHNGNFLIENVPAGEYTVHIWVEGEGEQPLAKWTHTIRVGDSSGADAGDFHANSSYPQSHLDKFGKPYKRDPGVY